MDFTIQIILVLAILFLGARKGGLALGLFGGIGVIILVFGFGLKPGTPPVKVMLIMLAVITAGATLQASGGLDAMLQVAEKILRKNPKRVTFLAPLTTLTLTFLCGTGHVVYTMLPIIYDISIKKGIRPERAMAASTIAAQMGIIISPVSVAVVSLVAMLAGHPLANGHDISLVELLSITIPGALCGVFMVGLFSSFRGKDLDKDEEFQQLISTKEGKEFVYGGDTTLLDKVIPAHSWNSMWIFLGAIAVVAIIGAFPELRPHFGKKALSMTDVIQMFMLGAGSIIFIVGKVKPADISNNAVFKSGMVALVAVYGVAWMTKTMFGAHIGDLKAFMGDMLKTYPWAYALILIFVSKLVNSQGAALAAIVPIATAINVNPGLIAGFAAACYGYYILPTYPSDLAALSFDRSGTTKIGKYVINHSFILPGLIGVGTASTVGYILANAYGYL